MSNRFIALFPYYSIPELPDNCELEFNKNLLLRDMFGCTSKGKDIHYEYPKFQDFSYDRGCNRRYLPTVLDRFANGFETYILFRTTNWGSKNRKKLISGYYKVTTSYRVISGVLRSDYILGCSSNEHCFLSREDSLKPEWIIQDRGVVYSENKNYTKPLNDALDQIIKLKLANRDLSNDYQSETIKMLNQLKESKFRKKIFSACRECGKEDCLLKIKIEKFYNKTRKNYLDYIYHPKVYLTDILNKKKQEIIKSV